MASWLEHMPDIVLLKVFNYLNTDDLLNLSKYGDRIQELCSEKLLVRNCSFEGCYHVKEDELKKHIKKSCRWIQSLDLNHCYWWSSKIISWTIGKCKDLRELHLLECRIKVVNLVPLLASLPQLISLSFSVQSIDDLRRDKFNPCSETIKHLKKLYVYYSSREESLLHYIGEQTTLLDHCEDIEEILIGSAGMAIPELYRPLISNPNNFMKLKVMGITNNIHAGAQMLYYGTLSQVPNAQLHFKSLIMPNVNFPEFMRRPEYSDCLRHMDEIQHLDIYGSKVTFPMEAIDIKRATQLKHISLGASRISGPQLKNIVAHCVHLTSINLFNCDNLFKGKPVYQGIEALFHYCTKLKHFNLGGEHHHFYEMVDGSLALTFVKGLQSLCIGTCMLYEEKIESRRSGKRSVSCRSPGALSVAQTKRRCLAQISGTSPSSSPNNKNKCDVSSSSDDSFDSEPSTSSGIKRVSHFSQYSSDNINGNVSVLERLVKNNPNLSQLEIIAPDLKSLVHQNCYMFRPICTKKGTNSDLCYESQMVKDIECIHQLSRLESLTLVGIPGIRPDIGLPTIMRNCNGLKILSLAYLGINALSSSYSAFKELNNLKDLRIEQPNMSLKSDFFECLGHCHRLERLCIIAKQSNYHPDDVLKLVEQLQMLIVLQLFGGNTISACKTLTTNVNKKFHKLRPALSVFILPVTNESIASVLRLIPAKHFQELTRFSSKVAAFPPGMRI